MDLCNTHTECIVPEQSMHRIHCICGGRLFLFFYDFKMKMKRNISITIIIITIRNDFCAGLNYAVYVMYGNAGVLHEYTYYFINVIFHLILFHLYKRNTYSSCVSMAAYASILLSWYNILHNIYTILLLLFVCLVDTVKFSPLIFFHISNICHWARRRSIAITIIIMHCELIISLEILCLNSNKFL